MDWIRSLIHRPEAKLRNASLLSLRYVVLDTELTSLDSRTNRLLSVGAVAMQGTSIRFGEQFYRVANPGVEVPRESIVVHGLRPTDVAEGEKPGDVLNELREFLGDSVIIGHFVGIDTKILRKELRGSESFPLDNPVLDTARAHHWLAQHGLRLRGLEDSRDSLSLASLVRQYGIEMKDAHHALYDAFLTAQLWQQLIPRLVGAGVETLGKALRIAGG